MDKEDKEKKPADVKVEDNKGADAKEAPESKVSASLAAEIESGVSAVIEDVEKKRSEGKKRDEAGKFAKKDTLKEGDDDLPSAKDQAGDDGSEGKTSENGEKKEDDPPKVDAAGKPGVITDEFIERAVKAGMTISDAKAFQNVESLNRVCSILEAGASKKVEPEAGKKADDSASAKADPLSAIPDLDPKEYDESIVAGFKAMKDLIRSQQEVIRGMKSEGDTQNGAWFEGQIAALGEGYVGALGADVSKLDPKGPQAAKRAELENKFKVLSAGYKAAGQNVDRKTVFGEAVSVVLGDVAAKVASDAKVKALKERQAQHVARPTGGKLEPAADVRQEVAGVLDRKYFGKQ